MPTISLSKFYSDQVLPAFRYKVGEEDMISILDPLGRPAPAKVDGKRLVVPTKDWLRKGFGDDYIAFHPLSEKISRLGTSQVLQHMQRQVKANLMFTVKYLTSRILEVAADSTLHKDIPPECSDFLKKLSGAKPDTIEWFNKVVKAAEKRSRFVSVYLKANGKFDGKTVNRICVIRFPIVEDLYSKDDILGVNVPKKQRPVLIELFKLVVPFGDSPTEYSAGTVERVAPYFVCLIQAFNKITTQLNSVIDKYRLIFDDAIQPYSKVDEKVIADFAKMQREIPSLDGNEGVSNEVEEEASETVNPVAQIPVQKKDNVVKVGNTAKEQTTSTRVPVGTTVNVNPSMSQAVAMTQAPQRPLQQVQTSNKASIQDLLNAGQKNQFAQPGMMQQPVMMNNNFAMPGMMQPQQPMMANMHPQMMQLMGNQMPMGGGFAQALNPSLAGNGNTAMMNLGGNQMMGRLL